MSSRGFISKCWYLNTLDNNKYLVKGNSNDRGLIGLEPYSEFIAYKIGKLLNYPMLEYKLLNNNFNEVTTYNIEHVSICKSFLRDNADIITLNNIMDMYGITTLKELNKFPFYNFIQSVLILDAFLGNEDGHTNNFEFMIKDNKIYNTPVFDNGASLFGWYFYDGDLDINLDRAKPYEDTHTKQLNLIEDVSVPYSKSDVDNLFKNLYVLLSETPYISIYRIDFIYEYLCSRRKFLDWWCCK